MLDAFIIDRIRRERERREREREDAFIPLQIDEPRGSVPPPQEEDGDRPQRGSVVIDFHV